MALFYEVEIPQDKPVLYAIQKLYGIGSSEAFQFCNELGIGRDVTVASLAKDEWQDLIQAIEKHGVANYLGGATFLEKYEAFRLNKKIYLFRDFDSKLFSIIKFF